MAQQPAIPPATHAVIAPPKPGPVNTTAVKVVTLGPRGRSTSGPTVAVNAKK